MRSTFVETSNYSNFMKVLGRVEARGARETCMIVVDGKPGLGKTATMNRWMTQTGSIYLRAHESWTYNWFMQELLTELGVKDFPINPRERFAMAVDLMEARADASAERGMTFGMVIDECDLVSRKPSVMEGIRAFSDLRGMPTILVGMGKLRDNLRRFQQIESRVGSNKAEFLPATLEDARALVKGLCEVPVADDMIQLIWKLSKGFNREMVDAIKNVERFGFRINPGPDGVTMADMRGQLLMNNRETGKDIFVPEVI